MDNKVTTQQKLKRITCIGGGTGTFVVLSGLKQYPFHLSAVVTMSDSGGSNKRIRDEFGLLPTSDIRQCLIALSAEKGRTGLLRQLFMYRFEKGNGISGMTFGNLFMAALSDILGSQEEAIKQTGKVLRIGGAVIPVSFSKTNLFATYADGHTVSEEHLIDEPEHDGKMEITKAFLKPRPTANPQACLAIEQSDVIVIGPGDLYTSILPNLLVPGISAAIKKSKAKLIFVLNLMTKNGQTYNMSAKEHVKILEKHTGRHVNVVIVNSAKYPDDVLKKYKKLHEFPVVDDLEKTRYYTVVRKPVVAEQIIVKSKTDTLVRSLIRHDDTKLAKEIVEIVEHI